MFPLIEKYRSSSNSWNQSNGFLTSSDNSSNVTPIPDVNDRANHRQGKMSHKYEKISNLYSSRDYGPKPSTKDSQFRDFEPERNKMRKNNWENRTFSRGSVENKFHQEKVCQ